MKLNLGCGSQVIEGWINVDYALGAQLAKVPLFRILNRKFKFFNLDWDDRIHLHDLTKRFPWKDNSVDIVYSSHVLEHFTYEEGIFFLKEAHRVMRKGGIIRIVVPDLEYFIKEYNEGRLSSVNFVKELGLERNSIKLLNLFKHLIAFPHKCMYDLNSLLDIMHSISFISKKRNPFDSDIEDIMSIELEERTVNAIIIEGRK